VADHSARDPSGSSDEGDRHETPTQRLDRNWNELLQELRVAQTGAQILAAVLLTVPFQQRFTELSHGQLVLYLVSVALAGLTPGLLVAPVAWHRMSFRQGQRGGLVRLANASARAGLLCLSLVISSSLSLVFWVAVDRYEALWAGAVALVVLVGGWFAVPLLALRRDDD
jgi:hypothetical protein